MVKESAKAETADAEIARVAGQQHGIVTSRQLAAAGLRPAAITKRVRAGRLHRVHRGVYAVGFAALSREARWMAAVLACGPGAVLSHRSAAALWKQLTPKDGPVDVTVPTRSGRRRRVGIRVHRRAALPPGAATMRDLIPVTAPWKTIEDLEGTVEPWRHRQAIRQAEVRRFALGPRTRGDPTRSDLERDFLRLCHHHDLPLPEVNVKVGRWTVDFLWRAEQLAVETDSWRFHGGSIAFEDDHARDADLRARGYAVHRFTERQVLEQPDLVAADLIAALQGSA